MGKYFADVALFTGEATLLLDLLLSVVLGFIIGFERKLRMKEAGIRTHTIVCVGAALMMVVSMNAFGDAAEKHLVIPIPSTPSYVRVGIISVTPMRATTSKHSRKKLPTKCSP